MWSNRSSHDLQHHQLLDQRISYSGQRNKPQGQNNALRYSPARGTPTALLWHRDVSLYTHTHTHIEAHTHTHAHTHAHTRTHAHTHAHTHTHTGRASCRSVHRAALKSRWCETLPKGLTPNPPVRHKRGSVSDPQNRLEPVYHAIQTWY